MSIFSKLFSSKKSKEKGDIKTSKLKATIVNNNIRKNRRTTSKSNKRKVILNERTGYPMSTKKSIDAALSDYEECIKTIQYNRNHPYEPDFEFLSTIYSSDDIQNFRRNKIEREYRFTYMVGYSKGVYLYKKGEWDKAEKEWLSIFNLASKITSEKLAIMYHKENRLQDEIKIVKLGIMKANKLEFYPSIDNLKKRLARAEKYYERHWHDDVSKGIDPKML